LNNENVNNENVNNENVNNENVIKDFHYLFAYKKNIQTHSTIIYNCIQLFFILLPTGLLITFAPSS